MFSTTTKGKSIALPRPAGHALRVTALDSGFDAVRCPHCLKLNTMEREHASRPPTHGSFRCVACHRVVTLTAISA
jgi:hypothetical protein